MILYDSKNEKISNNTLLEIDLDDLEKFRDYDEIKDFSKIPSKLIGDKTVLEWFKIDNYSAWWLVYQMIYPKYQEAVLFIERLSICINNYSPKVLEIRGCYDKIDLIKQICNQKNIDFQFSKSKMFCYDITKIKNQIKKKLYKQITKNKIKNRLAQFKEKNFILPTQNFILFTVPGIYNREMYDIETNISKNQEFILQPILNQLEDNSSYYCIDIDYTLKGDITSLTKRLSKSNRWLPLEVVLTFDNPDISLNLNLLKNQIKKMFELIDKDFFSFMNINFLSFMKNIFNEIFLEPNLPTYLKLFSNLELFLKEHRPTKIIQVYETGPYAKVFEFVSKKLGITTIGIQHGIIYDNNPDYFHKEILTNFFLLGNPLPDKIWVFGEYYKNILIKNGIYSENNISVIGNPSFYKLHQINKINTRKTLQSNYNKENKITILFPLSFRLSKKENNPDLILLKFLNEQLKNRNDILLLIRPHPGDISDIIKILSEFSSSFILSSRSLIEDLLISDLIITVTSTVGFDAVFMKKPTFYVDIAGLSLISLGGIKQKLFLNKLAFFVPIQNLINEIDNFNYNKWSLDTEDARNLFFTEFSNNDLYCDFKKLIFDN